MIDSDLVWARDPHDGYIQGKIGEIGAHEYEIVPTDSSLKKRNCPIEDVFPSCEAKSDHDDNCKYPDTHDKIVKFFRINLMEKSYKLIKVIMQLNNFFQPQTTHNNEK